MGQMNRHVSEHRTRDTRGVKRTFSRVHTDVNSHLIFTKTKLHVDELYPQHDPYCKFIGYITYTQYIHLNRHEIFKSSTKIVQNEGYTYVYVINVTT
jgi:hypothetical protein